MNRILNPEQALKFLAAKLKTVKWSQGNKVVTGTIVDKQLRLRYFPTGLTVAITVNRPLSQVASACLLQAAIPEACDDSLYIGQEKLWLLRRYASVLTEVELDLLFKQHQVVTEIFVPRKRALPPRTATERYA